MVNSGANFCMKDQNPRFSVVCSGKISSTMYFCKKFIIVTITFVWYSHYVKFILTIRELSNSRCVVIFETRNFSFCCFIWTLSLTAIMDFSFLFLPGWSVMRRMYSFNFSWWQSWNKKNNLTCKAFIIKEGKMLIFKQYLNMTLHIATWSGWHRDVFWTSINQTFHFSKFEFSILTLSIIFPLEKCWWKVRKTNILSTSFFGIVTNYSFTAKQ